MSNEEELDDKYGDEYESGPFCRHWGDPADCDELCKCGHRCDQHATFDDGECEVEGCACIKFEDAEGGGL